MKAITENTKISVGLLIALMGGIAWLTSLHAITQSNATVIEKVQVKQDQYAADISDIKKDIAVIKSKILEEKEK
jgi:hypothetical protein